MSQYYNPTQSQVQQAPQVDTRGINQSIQGLQGTLTDIQNNEMKRRQQEALLQQQKIENDRADSLLGIQQAAATRAQAAYDKKLKDQGTINSVLSAKNVGTSTVDPNFVNQQYQALRDKYGFSEEGHKQAIKGFSTKELSYQKDLSALDKAVKAHILTGTNQYYGSHAQVVDNIQQDLIAKGVDYQTAKTLAESKAQDLMPMIDAKTLADQKKYNLDLMKAMYPNKSGSNNVYINGGSGTADGPNQEVITRGQAINDIANIIKENDDGQDLKSWLDDKYGKSPATAKNMWKLVLGARKAHLSDYQIAAELQGSIERNFLVKDTIPNLNDFVARAKLNNTKSSRTTFKGGNSPADTLLMEADKKKAFDNLIRQNALLDRQASPAFDRYQYDINNAFDRTPYVKPKENKHKTDKSTSLFDGNDALSKAMHSKTGDNTLKNLFDKNQSKFWEQYRDLNADEQKRVNAVMKSYPVGSFKFNTPGDDGVNNSDSVHNDNKGTNSSKSSNRDINAHINALQEEIDRIGEPETLAEYDKRDKLETQRDRKILTRNLETMVTSGGLSSMSTANKERWAALGEGIRKGVINTAELPKNVLDFYLKNTKKLQTLLEGRRGELLKKERRESAHDVLFDINPIAPDKLN